MGSRQTTALHTYPITLDEIDLQHPQPCKGGEFLIALHNKIIVGWASVESNCVADVGRKGRRVKERSKENSATSDGEQDNSKNTTHLSPQSSHDVARKMDIPGANGTGPWYGWPQEAPTFGSDQSPLILGQDLTSMSLLLYFSTTSVDHLRCTENANWCNCSGISGPCDFHQEQMRVLCSSAIATPTPSTNLYRTTEIQTDPSIPIMRQKPALQLPILSTQSPYSPLDHGSSRNSLRTNFHSPPESEPSQKVRKQRDHTPNNTPSTTTTTGRNSSAATPFDGTNGTNTIRFQTILDAVQAAGFESFDAAVSDYYTHAFEKNSAVDLAQKTSRARRLGGVMTSLHDSSATWTLWEARGYRHQVVEAAESIYVNEVSRLANSRKRKRDGGPAPSRGSRSSSELEGSSSEFEANTPSTASSRSQHGSGTPRTSLVELQRVYQNKVSSHPIPPVQDV